MMNTLHKIQSNTTLLKKIKDSPWMSPAGVSIMVISFLCFGGFILACIKDNMGL